MEAASFIPILSPGLREREEPRLYSVPTETGQEHEQELQARYELWLHTRHESPSLRDTLRKPATYHSRREALLGKLDGYLVLIALDVATSDNPANEAYRRAQQTVIASMGDVSLGSEVETTEDFLNIAIAAASHPELELIPEPDTPAVVVDEPGDIRMDDYRQADTPDTEPTIVADEAEVITETDAPGPVLAGPQKGFTKHMNVTWLREQLECLPNEALGEEDVKVALTYLVNWQLQERTDRGVTRSVLRRQIRSTELSYYKSHTSSRQEVQNDGQVVTITVKDIHPIDIETALYVEEFMMKNK